MWNPQNKLRFCLLLLAIAFALVSTAQQLKPVVYCIAGQGSDYRLFNKLELGEAYDVRFVHHSLPDEDMSMRQYAERLSEQIDTCEEYILLGVSLGGMLAVEMNEFLDPQKVIVISSAKCREELPARYPFQRDIPIYKWVSAELSKKGALILQPLVEPDRNQEEATFEAMLRDKDPIFLKRTIAMILEWEREDCPSDIVHIHGDLDRTIPARNVHYNYLIEDGSHMMALTRGEEISGLIMEILEAH